MLTETGKVVAVDGDAVWVETLRGSACGRCAARSGCGHDLMNRLAAGGSRGIVRARRAAGFVIPLAVHDFVTLALPEKSFLKAASLLYLLPLVLTVVGALSADSLFGDVDAGQGRADLLVVLGAAAGLTAGLALATLLGRRAGANSAFEPTVTAKH